MAKKNFKMQRKLEFKWHFARVKLLETYSAYFSGNCITYNKYRKMNKSL